MAKKYLDYDGLLYFWQKIKANFVTDVTYNSTTKKIQKTKAGSTSDVVTLSTVATSGSYNDLSNKPSIPTIPNNFGTVKVGSTNVAADTTSDTLELVAGTNVTLTPDATNDKVTIAATDTTYEVASTTADGLMSSADKVKLNGIATGAEVNQNAFSNVKVGTTTIAADTKTDTLELAAGTSISITPDATNDKVTIGFNGTIPSAGTGSNYPKMDGTKSLGSNAGYARVDHVHPTDTTRAPIASPAFTGTPTAPTAATGTSTTQIATTEFVANTVGAITSGVSDVQVDSTSVVTNGVATLASGSNALLETGTDSEKRLWSSKVLHDSITHYGVCSTNSATVAKTVSIDGVTSLYSGLRIAVYFENENTANDPTLNVNSLGAKRVMLSGGGVGTEVARAITANSKNQRVLNGLVSLIYSGEVSPCWIVESKQMPSDWNAISGSTQILNKPTIVNTRGTATSGGTKLSVVNTGDMYIWNNKLDASQKGAASGVCPLNASSKIDATYLPSYVDDVIEAYPVSGATALSAGWLSATSDGSALTPETGKIYVLMADSGDYAANTQFRWGGSAYVKLADGGVSSITNAEIDTIVAA